MKLGEAIEQVLINSGLSISAFSRKSGYSRQYLYQLLKCKSDDGCHNVQLDTLKKICDTAGYGFERLLADIGYIESPKQAMRPNTVVIVGQNGDRTSYALSQKNAAIVADVVKALQTTETVE